MLLSGRAKMFANRVGWATTYLYQTKLLERPRRSYSNSVRERYGEDCGEVFQCHHRVPLGSVIGSRKTRKADLAVLCPLCHAAIHGIFPMPTVEELRVRLQPT